MTIVMAQNGTDEPMVSSLRPSPRTLTTLPEILSSLSSLQSEEAELSVALESLMSSQDPIIASLAHLRGMGPHLDELQLDASLLSSKVLSTAKTAERVGGRVRLLDEEMRRVKEACDRVGQVIELKSSLASLQSSIEAQDWESATRHCARAMSLPAEVLSGRFAESAVPTSESPLPPVQTLQAAREQLLEIFLRQFKQASQARDAAGTSRFFKLFPPIGWEKEGLDVYSSFVLGLVQTKPPPSTKTSSPLYYTTALTALFESVCNIAGQHQPVVEKYYGQGKMLYVVAKLVQECDRVVKNLTEGWEEDRSMKRKLIDTSAGSFSALTSPTARKQPSQAGATGEESLDPREIDRVLSEASAMTMRYTAFRKFLYNNLQNARSEDDQSFDEPANLASTPPFSSMDPRVQLRNSSQSASEEATEMDFVESSGCKRVFDNLITTYYIPLEIWYLRSTINQAHLTSMTDSSQSPPTTTVPDLVFYLLRTVLHRILNTGSITVIKQIFEQLREVMDRDYTGVIKRQLDDVYQSAGTSSTGGRGEKADKESRLGFIVHLNDLDVSSSHMERLVKDILTSQAIQQNFLEQELTFVKTSVSSLLVLQTRYNSTLKAGIEQLFNQLMRPRLRTLITDVYKDVTYVLDEDAYTTSEYQDIVRKRFTKAWETLVDGYKDTFTDSNYRMFFGLAVDVLVRPWEKFIMGFRFTELGAIRFDRDIRAISTYLSSQTAFGDAREKFIRLQQMSTLLNLDREEDVDEFFSSSGITWKLNVAEARSIVALKV